MIRRSLFAAVFLVSSAASAMSIDWSGNYRFEVMHLDKPTLSSPSGRKYYGLNYLSLSPKIIASDGINIIGKFDVLQNSDATYQNTQMGMLWGDNPNGTAESQTMEFSPLRVSQLYMTLEQENGTLLVGRAPYEFGMGLYYNAGNGAFDHWLNTGDYVGYKVLVGNLSLMPMIGRIYSEGPGDANIVQEEIFEVKYESKDTGSMIGAMMGRRKSSANSNGINGTAIGGANPTPTGPYSMENTGFTFGRTWESFVFRMEGQFMKGDYGVSDANGEQISNSSYGIAIEMDFPRPQSTWEGGLKLGVASGDDPTTRNQEGFFFNRNYDVAMLLFNHRLGSSDLLGTDLIKDPAKTVSDSLDDEAISNVAYIAPQLRYAWSPRLSITNTLTYAQLMTNVQDTPGLSKDLGLEWDIGFDYRPRENVRWENRIGLLLPGGAFKNGDNDTDNAFTFGFQSRAAITF